MGITWTEAQLSEFRMQGDREVDQLVAALLPKKNGNGVRGYNHALLVIDQLMETPELTWVRESRLARCLREVPEELLGYFDPMPAPEWVDVDKLKLGSRLWRDNTIASLAVLYSASLPSCYLMKRGIPALYRSEKLREQRYIFQRIYETGRMLEAVMDPGGIQVLEDKVLDEDELLCQALRNLEPMADWRQSGRGCRKSSESDALLDVERVTAEVDRLRQGSQRYLWGKGYLCAKKVRFLHATMRFMLVQPDQRHPLSGETRPLTLTEALSCDESPWNFEDFGYPINQEDMAYTLLTFGMIIPRGLSHWGVQIDQDEKEAFLHLWKVVGHVMGIDSTLLTDQWEEAEQQFSMIQARQAGHSHAGEVLTEALTGFLGDYLPEFPGMSRYLSVAMICSQIGPQHARMIVPEKTLKETFRFWRRPVYSIAGVLTRGFFRLKHLYLKHFTHLGGMTVNRLHEAAEHIIDSWRSAYQRRPFFVPQNATTWVRRPEVDAAYIADLKNWRRRLFSTLGIAMVLLMAAFFSLPGTLVLWLASGQTGAIVALGVAGAAWLASMGLMHGRLQKIFDQRPEPGLKDRAG